jgi:hypothetical protein
MSITISAQEDLSICVERVSSVYDLWIMNEFDVFIDWPNCKLQTVVPLVEWLIHFTTLINSANKSICVAIDELMVYSGSRFVAHFNAEKSVISINVWDHSQNKIIPFGISIQSAKIIHKSVKNYLMQKFAKQGGDLIRIQDIHLILVAEG